MVSRGCSFWGMGLCMSDRTLAATLPTFSDPPCFAGTSSLWGKNGERFKVGGRLLDYSYAGVCVGWGIWMCKVHILYMRYNNCLPHAVCCAGYMAGEAEIPSMRSTHNVKSYGAKGNGRSDDSNAFRRAIADMDNGDVLRIPAGRCVPGNGNDGFG